MPRSFIHSLLTTPYSLMTRGFMGFILLLAFGCQALEDSEPKSTIGPEGAISIIMPSSLTAFAECTSITAEVVVDDGTPIPLTVDCSTETVSGTIDDLEAGEHTFVINYFASGFLVGTASTNATITADETTLVVFDSTDLAFPDDDADGVNNLDELTLGSDPTDPSDPLNQPPNGTIDSPTADVAILTGESVNFTGNGTDPDDNLPLTFLWNFNGGATNQTVEDPGAVVFDIAGIYKVTFTVTDSLLQADPSPDSRIITVNNTPNQEPNGTIDTPSGDVTIFTGESVNFTGTGTDPDSNLPLTFLWDFGGGAANQTVEDPGSVVFGTVGIYTVTFTVTDILLLSDPTSDSRVITVNDPPNQAPNGTIDTPSGDLTITVGQSVNFMGTGTDPDGNLPLTFIWDFGGGASNQQIEDPGAVVFATTGIYNVSFTVTDSLSLSDPMRDTRTIIVNPPIIADNFENGIIDTTLWEVGGAPRGCGPSCGSDTGSWLFNHQEVIDPTDGFLEANVSGPTSGNTYGAEAWMRTVHDFNDNGNHIINFSWEPEFVDTHFNKYFIQITDGFISSENNLHWPDSDIPGTVHLLYDPDTDNRGWDFENEPNPGMLNWSIKIGSSGVAEIYDAPDSTGNLLFTATLDSNDSWYLRFMVSDGTSSGFPAGDATLKLYDFDLLP